MPLDCFLSLPYVCIHMWMWLSTICVVPEPTSNVSPCCLSPRSYHIYVFIYYFQGTHINTHHFIVHCRSEHNLVVSSVLSFGQTRAWWQRPLSADPSLLDPFPPFLRKCLLLFIADHTRLLSLEASRDTPVSSTHLDSGALELEKGLAQTQLRSSISTASTLPWAISQVPLAVLQLYSLWKKRNILFSLSPCVLEHTTL